MQQNQSEDENCASRPGAGPASDAVPPPSSSLDPDDLSRLHSSGSLTPLSRSSSSVSGPRQDHHAHTDGTQPTRRTSGRQWSPDDSNRPGQRPSVLSQPRDSASSSAVPSSSGRSGSGSSASSSSSRPSQAQPPLIRRSSRHAKREHAMDPSSSKKARTGRSPPRRLEMPPSSASSPASILRAHKDSAKSPLFFSNASSKNLIRPASFSTADASSSMLARIREDPGESVTTLKLPRATVSAADPPRSGSTPGSWGSSMDTSAPALSPDARPLPPGLQMLHGVGVIELLEQDERPTFLIDLSNAANSSRPDLHILYYNMSLRGAHHVLSLLSVGRDDTTTATDFALFKAWAMSITRAPNGADLPLPSHTYGGITWTCSTLRRRFRFISGSADFLNMRSESPGPLIDEPAIAGQLNGELSPSTPATPLAGPVDAPDYFADPPRKLSLDSSAGGFDDEMDTEDTNRRHPDAFTNQVLQSQPIRSTFDWTRIPVTDNLSDHIKFAKTIDWASTPLGPMDDWSHDLRVLSNMIMGSPHPAAMYWGPQFVCIYNAAYIELAGQKHPALMGARYQDAWHEIWSEIEPIFQSALDSGQAIMKHDNRLFIDRHGFLEETFFSWSIVPLVGADGQVMGLYNPSFENTRRKVNERRMLTLREVGERTATATSVGSFWPQVQKGLEFNEFDVPFTLIYSATTSAYGKEDTESELSSLHSGSFSHAPQLVLEGAIGVPEGHPAAVTNLDMRTSDEGFVPFMRQSLTAGGVSIVLSQEDGNLPTDLLQGLDWRGFGDPSRAVVVFPIIPTTASETVTGFIVLGINPRRPYNDDYKLFVHLLARQLATSMASVVLFEEEIKRGQRAARLAALDRQELSMQLIQRTQEASESEYKFTRMAEFAPVGMFIADSHGMINYCNDMWWQISRLSRAGESQNTWMDSVRDEDRPALQVAWRQLLEDKITISVEFRFKHSQKSGDNTIDTWVLMSVFPEQTADGDLTSIFGCITDISSQKWAEKVQNERREEAVELKRQQENFIDITSHEMRNPLSAVLQCADQIANNITAFTAHEDKAQLNDLLESCLDAANTINLCASHQKRIVDDVLTLSKLDSNLLAVTPVDEQPVRVVQRALKMFESELIAHEIDFEFRVDPSFDNMGIKWAKLDPSRLRQVLINLMTNAIKFTQGRERRNIVVSLGASRDFSELEHTGVQYFRRTSNPRGPTLDIDGDSDWGNGNPFLIHCSVEDTGPGLSEEELKLLFQRFQQASPRTHVQYGGSGLGLFISRILTEIQGGQIGVSSRSGFGSKFSFYIQSRECLDPHTDYEHIAPFKIACKTQSPGGAAPPPPQLTRNPSTLPAPAPGAPPLFDVLIVEDNIVNQRVLQRQLRSAGNNTFVANHGREALQTLERSRFWLGHEEEGVDISVILMDLEMPVMDGMTCARRIRELEREGTIVQHIPIIAVTAYARPEQIANAKAAGIDDVISKPFRIPELIPKIEELVARYKNLSVSN